MVRTRADDPSRPEGAPRPEPLWRRWYVPWRTAALVLAGLMAAAMDRAPGVESTSTER